MRRIYSIFVTINDTVFRRVVIGPHYEQKHRKSVSDELIVRLVHRLDGGFFPVDGIDAKSFAYFVNNVRDGDKMYRLVWLIPPDRRYIGVINCFRSSYDKT